MSVLRKLASQTAIYGLSSIIGRVANWALTPLYTDRMEPGEYGIFNDLYAFTTYFLVILTFGMETAFFRFSGDDKKDTRPYTQSFVFVSLLSLVFLVIFGLGYERFAGILGYGDRPDLVLMLVVITFLDVLVALPMAKLRYDDRPMAFATVSLLGIFLNIVLNLIFILAMGESSAEYVFLANVIASAFKVGLLAFLAFPIAERLRSLGSWAGRLGQIKLLPENFKVDKVLMRSMLGFGLYIMIAGLFGMINQFSDVNFVQRIWGPEEMPYKGGMYDGSEMAGIFSANKKLAVLILLVTQAFRYAAEPFFFRHARESKGRGVYAKVFHYFMLASLVVFLFVSSFSYEIVSFQIFGFQLVDEAYWLGLEVVPLMLFSFVLWGGYTNLTIWYKLTKQVRFGLLFSAIGVAVMVLFNFILIPRWSYMGATWAMVISYTAMCTMVYFVGQKYFPIPYRIERMLLYGGLFVGAFFLNGLLADPGGPGGFWVKVLVCLGTCGVVVLMERRLPIKWDPPGSVTQTPLEQPDYD